ncbi:MAG: NAD-dependent epimerase/dehydratase family protein [Patescibacteria group bacterium]
MRIIITGARGFAGAHLGNALTARNHTVLGIDDLSAPSGNPVRFPIKIGKARSLKGDLLKDTDVLIHLAARINVDESILEPSLYFTENVGDTLELLETVRRHAPRIKFIYASTSEVYGSGDNSPMSEVHPLRPASPYAVSKLAAEQLCANYRDIHGLDMTIARNFNTFGEYQRDGMYGGVIPKFVSQGLAKKPITVFGDGTQSRDYMHVSQAINGYIMATEGRMPALFNCGSGQSHRIIDIAKAIAKKFHVPITHHEPRPNEVQYLCVDCRLAQKHGYPVTTDFWAMLDSYCDWRKEPQSSPHEFAHLA